MYRVHHRFDATLLAVLVATLAVPAQSDGVDVVATGLNNPRGLNFAPDGRLYVAEAGSGGNGDCAPAPEGIRCYGNTSSVTVIDLRKVRQQRLATGIPSLGGDPSGPTPGDFATGVHDISFQGIGGGWMTIGFGGDPRDREIQFPGVGTNFGQQARLDGAGRWRLVKDLGRYEIESNPTGDEIDSNPYGILALAGKQLVVDAGAYDLLEIRSDGSIATLATFPNRDVPNPFEPGEISMDAVPTSVALGPDGYYYVGQLTGFPFPVADANVYRVPRGGGIPEVFLGGFTAVIDLAFGPDGSLYVVEIARNGLLAAFVAGDWTGALIRVAPDGSRTEISSGELFAPGGLALGPDGSLYVTNNSIYSGLGEVVRIRP